MPCWFTEATGPSSSSTSSSSTSSASIKYVYKELSGLSDPSTSQEAAPAVSANWKSSRPCAEPSNGTVSIFFRLHIWMSTSHADPYQCHCFTLGFACCQLSFKLRCRNIDVGLELWGVLHWGFTLLCSWVLGLCLLSVQGQPSTCTWLQKQAWERSCASPNLGFWGIWGFTGGRLSLLRWVLVSASLMLKNRNSPSQAPWF